MEVPTGIRHRHVARKLSTSTLSSPPSSNDTTSTAQSDFTTHTYTSLKPRTILLLCIAFRAAVALLGQKTFFQPDEFYQSLEPAHRLVWGTGFETWEWRGSSAERLEVHDTQLLDSESHAADANLPINQEIRAADFRDHDRKSQLRYYIQESPFWSQVLLGRSSRSSIPDDGSTGRGIDGMLRSWIWPLLFALPYWLLKVLNLDNYGQLLVLAPRLPMILFAALTDFYTYRLAGRILGKSYREAALFLSFTNLFHAYVLTRTLTTSAETCLTVIALYHWPLPLLDESHRWGSDQNTGNKAMQQPIDVSKNEGGTTDLQTKEDQDGDNLDLSLALSAAAFVLRPTNIVLWSFLGLELCNRSWIATRKIRNVVKLVGRAMIIGIVVISLSVLADFLVTGRVYLPFLTFLTYNIIFGISKFYGSSPWHYHITQSMPILLATSLPFSIPSFVLAMRESFYSTSHGGMNRSAALRSIRLGLLTKSVIVTLAVWSCIKHKEWRFLHPLLPVLLLYPTRYLVDHYRPVEGGLWVSPSTCAHSFLRINRREFFYLLLSPILPYLYLSLLHGRAQVDVASWLRYRAANDSTVSVLFAMPCHSTPWMSHIHRVSFEEAEKWHFLTCEPPLQQPLDGYNSEVDAFYRDFESNIDALITRQSSPTLIVLFDTLYRSQKEGSSAKTLYKIIYRNAWNGADVFQDDARRKGGIVVLEYLN